jgi:phage gp37-like protein
MLPGSEAGRPNRSRQTVCEDYNHFLVVVLMRDHGSEREALDGVTGREAITSMEEVPTSVTLEGPLPSG